MSKLYYESELYHHGVKGMKWGQRKTIFKGTTGGLYAKPGIPKNAKVDGYDPEIGKRLKKWGKVDGYDPKTTKQPENARSISSNKKVSKGKIAVAAAIAGIGATAVYSLFSKDPRYGLSAFDVIRDARK